MCILGDSSSVGGRTGVGRGIPPTSLHPGVLMRGRWPAGPLPSYLGLHGSPVVRAPPSLPDSQPSQSSSPRAQGWPGWTQVPALASARSRAAGRPSWSPGLGRFWASLRKLQCLPCQGPAFTPRGVCLGGENPRARTRTHTPSDAPDHMGSRPSRRRTALRTEPGPAASARH